MELKEYVYTKTEELLDEFKEVNDYIYAHPELGNEEYMSSQYLVDKISQYGFEVTYPYLDLPTAFRAELNCGKGPKIAFLAEYDALPGYGESGDQTAHACGHNWIAASTYGACVVLSQLKDHFNGTIVFIGTPAEETTGGKCDLVDRGAFDDIDAAFQMHLGAENNLNVVTLAIDSIEFNFEGVAAHAAAYPERGINALDAVQLTYAGINALRQHMQPDARVHGIITNGGQAANTVPNKAQCQFYIRAKKRAYLDELTQKVINCAKGAELMTGAKLSYRHFENSYDDLINHQGLIALAKTTMEDLGVTDFVENDENASGSSDIGNVSHVCPTCYIELNTGANPPAYAHNEDFLNCVSGTLAYQTLAIAVKTMAYTALQVYLDPTIIK
ncbi:MAG: M20 family metallopeptidase [Beduini sp.]|uniref:M20 family metallopeptidase n=1 Tax=Beduini sp. TaxID=1922300 RepID=UPI003990937D